MLLLVAMLLPMLPITALTAFAQAAQKEDAMEQIKADATLDAFRIGDTQRYGDDGYIGIPYEITVYYDKATHGTAVPGHATEGATPVILYVVNANIERIGTESDASIIQSMLDRGFAVAVLDYLNNDRAKSPALDFSAQLLRAELAEGEFFADKSVLPEGSYKDNLIVPAGYNVKFNDVFMELDKHGVDGTLDRIVNVWNNDFRLYHKDKSVKWVHEDGSRKETQNGFDGSSPVWYSDAAMKNKDDENGQYTKVQYTKAEVITDCVKPDGSPIDLNLYIHVIYPTSPEHEVPVMTMFSSSGYLMNGSISVARPQMQGFLFDGYAGVLFDYAWIPMGRNDHYGYFDGSSGSKSVTGDNQSYATYTSNSAQVSTAAIRYTRYLALSDPETYAFDIDALGVFGISKAAWMTQLGAPMLREDLYTPADGSEAEVKQLVNDKINGFYQQLMLPEHHGETRYDNGITEAYTVDGFTIDGGELQPWAVYDGYEISSGVQMVYSSCGASIDYFGEGYAPQFITENLQDNYNTEYGKQNELVSLCRNHNIPALWYEADIAHTFAEGLDWKYGVDIYDAFHEFADYYLKDDAVKVTYTDPKNGAVITANDTVTVKLIGDATAQEAAKITVVDSKGNAVTGTWESAYGDTEWTFTPNALSGGETYTLTVPADFAGKNGKAMGTAYTTSFYVRAEGEVVALSGANGIDENGSVVSVTVPSFANASGFALRVRVTNDAANLLSAYDAATGALLGSVRISGIGSYEIDLTDALAGYAEGSVLSVLLRTANADGNVKTYSENFNSGRGDFTTSSYAAYENKQTIAGETALKIVKKSNYGKFDGDYWFYERGTVITNKKLINGGSAVTRDDMGRRFVFKIRLYDTVSRRIGFQLNSCTSKTDKTLDFDRVIYTEGTVANQWCEYEIPYTVYELDYGFSQTKSFTMQINSTGNTEMPLYVDQFDVYEVFTDVDVSSVALVSKTDSDKPVKAPASSNAFSVGGTEYATWKDAMNAASSGATVTMLRNYVFTNADDKGLGGLTDLTIDLGGYRLSAENSMRALLWIDAINNKEMNVTLKNGSVVLGAMPLLNWNGASAAGSGKQVNLTLDNVYLATGKDFTALNFFTDEAIANNAVVNCDVTFVNSVIDIDRYQLPDRAVTLFGAGEGTLSINYAFKDSRLYINDLHELTLAETIADTQGNGLTLLVPASEGTPVISYRTEDGFAMPTATEREGGYVVFVSGDVSDATEYGAIPEKYADAELYPFIVFANDLCIGADTTFNAATVRANEYMTGKNGSTVQILMRRDLTLTSKGSDKLWKFNGHLVFDLGGHVLKRQAAVIEGMVEETYTTAFDTALTVKNGTILSATSGNGHVIVFEPVGKLAKNYDVRFEGITFAVADGYDPEYFITRSWSGSGADVNVTMTLVDCIFDFAGETAGSKVPTKKLRVFHEANSAVHLDICVVGGKILSSAAAPAYVTWNALGEGDKLFFEADENGQYITMTVPNGVVPSHSVPTKDGTLAFTTLVTDGAEKDVYTLTNDSVKTEYGSIPAANSGNVFALFMDGMFVGAADTWKDIQTLARTTLDANPGNTVTILMRQDHTHSTDVNKADRIAFMNGTVIVDLGGNTLTSSKTLFECGLPSSYVGSFDTTYTVKNGYINVRGGNFAASESRGDVDKKITLSFVDVEINLNGSSKDKLFITYGDNSYTGKCSFDILYDGCTLDLRGSTAKSFTLFTFGASNNNVCADITIKGGQILADKADNLKIWTFAPYKDTFAFAPDENGAYTTLTLPTGATLSTVGATDDQGRCVAFGDGVTVGGNTVYSLVENDRVTKYGIITSDRTAGFVAFCNGAMIYETNDWNAITDKLLGYFNSASGSGDSVTYPNFGKTVQILMLADYKGKGSSTTRISAMNGSLVLDLGGHTFTKTGTMFECAVQYTATSGSTTRDGYQKVRNEYNGGKDFATNVFVCNGTIAGASTLIAEEVKGVTLTADDPLKKVMNFTFDHVEFDVAASTTRFMLVTYNVAENAEYVTNLNYNDCIFDYSIVTESDCNFVHNNNGVCGGRIKTNVVISGGTVKGDMSKIKMSTTTTTINNEKITVTSFTYVRGEAGEYPIFELTAGSPPSKVTAIYNAAGSTRTNQDFAAVSTEGGVTTYKLGRLCKYGLIEPEYNYDKGVPFVIFMDGKAVAGGSNWANMTSALSTLFAKNPGKTATVYVQYDTVSGNAPAQLTFINGTVNIDLNGHSLTANAHTLFECGTNKYNDSFDTVINVMNGTILLGKGRVMAFESKTSSDKHFDVTFDGVTFGLVANYATTSGTEQRMFMNWSASGSGIVSAELDFVNCIFDMSGATAEKPVTVLNFDASNLDVDVTVSGGTIKADTADAINFYVDSTNGSLTLAKGEGNAYPAMILASGIAPTHAFDTAEGDGYYYKASEGTYLLGIGKAKITGAQLNIGSDLSMLYYVRIHDASLSIDELLMQFSMAGKLASVTASADPVGNEYIFVLTGIAPQQIGDKIDAILLLGDKEIGSKLQYSVKDNLLSLNSKDAETLGMSAEKHAAMKTLIADVLVYGNAAQNYVEYKLDAPVLDGSEAIVPSATAPTEADAMELLNHVDAELCFKNAIVRFDTVNEIRINIFVGKADASLVSVKIDGESYALSSLKSLGGGNYEIAFSDILATELDAVHTITLVYDGADGATLSYSVAAYAYAMQSSTNANMKALALALYSYGTSADAYEAIA